jgi:8-oxo-dGTP pyrophosphatase MutT (NUDIX family)
MKHGSAKPYIAVFIYFRRGNNVAFVLRKNTNYMDGYYDFPAGKVEKGETYIQAAIREAKEEVGIDLQPSNLKHALTIHRNAKDDKTTWVDVVFEAIDWRGELTNAEPEKHATLDWLDLNNLPSNVVPAGRFRLEQIEAGKRYAEYGWEE